MWGDIPEQVFEITRHLLGGLRLRDPLTYEHCLRVGRYSRLLAKAYGMNDYEQKVAEYSGIFHDIGKFSIAPSILHKPGPLTGSEFAILKHHPEVSTAMISPYMDTGFFRDITPGVKHHHERIDGRGYPHNLKGDEIPIFARLVLIVDAFDAMTQARSYRKGRPLASVIEELQRCAGSQFDSELVQAFSRSELMWKRELQEAEQSDDSARFLEEIAKSAA